MLDVGFHRRGEQGTTDIAVSLMEDAQVNLRFLKHKKSALLIWQSALS
jgi:hypothetical protein